MVTWDRVTLAILRKLGFSVQPKTKTI